MKNDDKKPLQSEPGQQEPVPVSQTVGTGNTEPLRQSDDEEAHDDGYVIVGSGLGIDE